MELDTLNTLFVDQLRDLYSAEKQLVKALPKMAKACTNEVLREGFETHLEETEEQVSRLEKIFEELGERSGGKKCAAMEGLIEEGTEVIKADGEPAVIDAGLIAAAQRVEHYEIAAYGTAREFAKVLQLEEVAELLEQTLKEEEATDQKLSEIAVNTVNQEALMAGESESEEEEEEDGTSPRGGGGGGRKSHGGRPAA
jgi:ferritin-like metal-binding protein YciE